jgi:hypothetical protein
MPTGNVRGGKKHANDSIVEAKYESVFNSVGFLIVSYQSELEMIWIHVIFDIFG